MDAQTWTTFAFGKTLPRIDFTEVLDYAYNNISSTGTINDTSFDGGSWYEGDTGVWLEGYAQLGAAYRFGSEQLSDGTSADNERAEAILNQMSAMQQALPL